MLFEPKFDKTYITSQAAEPENCHLACGFITRTDILFKKENVPLTEKKLNPVSVVPAALL